MARKRNGTPSGRKKIRVKATGRLATATCASLVWRRSLSFSLPLAMLFIVDIRSWYVDIRNDNRSGSSLVWDVKEQEAERSDLNQEQEAGRGDLNREQEAGRKGRIDQQKARAGGQGVTAEARARAMDLLTCSTIFKLNCRWATLTPSEHFCIARFSSPSPNQARIELLLPLIHRSVVSSINCENLPHFLPKTGAA
jgi:hypothetical protein